MAIMIIVGIWIGASLDTYNRFLNRKKRMKSFVFFNDCLFWVIQGLIIFYSLLFVNEGELRFYVFLALLCGYAAYQSLFKGIYLRLLERLITTIISIYRFLYRLVMICIIRPIRLLIQGTIALLLMLANLLWATLIVLYKIVLTPLKWILKLIWKLVPKRVKIFMEKKAGILTKIKNIVIRWWKRFRR